ncbi:Hexose transporter 1 [Plasmodiophora brassicae]|uniref:Hexose transporter 1 n=1 Tax=Plasmodiophora brassicae TaxID=37360 RepID=A0A0G4J324_PLABS|nr:hypothetical protein PBRA_008573 [Plasmodiophora brassicae]SPQ99469.1 unnamed protein product [Plasmodiophora brassicae]
MTASYGYLLAFAAAMGGLLFGYEIGVVSQVLDMPGFRLYFGMADRLADGSLEAIKSADETMRSLTTFSFLAGCFAGAWIVAYLADLFGRKRSILLGGGIFLIGAALQAFTWETTVYFAGRALAGVGVGILSMCSPLYISEAAPTEIRGRLVTVQQLMITLGICVAASINSILITTLQHTDIDLEWRLAMGMQCVPALLLVLTMSVVPESPRWLAAKGRDGESLAVIARLRASTPDDLDAVAAFDAIKADIVHEKAASWTELLAPGVRNRLGIVLGLQFWQQMTGINMILYYQGALITAMGFDPAAAAIPFTLANDVMNFVSTFPGMYLIERMGRRRLLFLGGIGMAVAHFLVFLFVGVSQTQATPSLAWGAIASVYLFFFFFASTWGPVVWAYQSEVFPQQVRAKGTGAGAMANWAANALIGLVTPFISGAIGYRMYLIFAAAGLGMSAFTYCFVPETMGKTLEQMDDVFGTPKFSKTAAPGPVVELEHVVA